MRIERVEEILRSSDNIKVFFENNPVWIESVTTASQTAHVKLLNASGHTDVPINELKEQS